VEESIKKQAEEQGVEISSIDSVALERGVRWKRKWTGIYNPPFN
jgi:hypothetical protein